MKMRSVLLSLGALSACFTIAVGSVGWWGLRALGHSMDESVAATQATQHATMGDMFHDGLRGDVFQALMFAQLGQRDKVAVARKEAQEHGQAFIDRVKALKALPLDADLQAKVAALLPVVEHYAAVGKEVCELAESNATGAQARLADFTALFEELEGKQITIIDAIEAHAKTTDAHSDATGGRCLK
jgi:hypothetical protein